LLVEDIATTGGQVLEAAKIITEAGAKIKKIVAVIDRKQGAGENIKNAGYKFESILTKEDLERATREVPPSVSAAMLERYRRFGEAR
jgi:orotate phosphoribosyltransferase